MNALTAQKRMAVARPTGLLIFSGLAFFLAHSHGNRGIVLYSIITLAAAGLIISALHIFVKELNPLARMVSEYATNPRFGEWMNAAFFLFGCGILSVGILYWHLCPECKALPVLTLIAGITTLLLGFFTMYVTVKNEVQVSPGEGRMHTRLTATSFSLALVTMVLFASYPPPSIIGYEWMRAVALCHFLYAALSALFFGLLGIGLQAHMQHPAVEDEPNIQDESSMHPNDPPMTLAQKRRAHKATENAMNRGLGLIERILIFMFLEWTLVLSFVAWYIG